VKRGREQAGITAGVYWEGDETEGKIRAEVHFWGGIPAFLRGVMVASMLVLGVGGTGAVVIHGVLSKFSPEENASADTKASTASAPVAIHMVMLHEANPTVDASPLENEDIHHHREGRCVTAVQCD
jgi:hypothetical protein